MITKEKQREIIYVLENAYMDSKTIDEVKRLITIRGEG